MTTLATDPVRTSPGLADTLYRPYFLGGIAVVLTAGAFWGAWLLWRIGLAGDFHVAGVHQINAHGHAQIFGWVGLFIMGVALQILPRLWDSELPSPKLAIAALGLMLCGLVLRTPAMAAVGASWAAPTALVGGSMELTAVVIVAGMLLITWRRRRVPMEPSMAFILAGFGWFVIQAAMGLWHTWTTMTAADRTELLWYVSTYQGPLRDLQIHGMALFMILGVSMRVLPVMFGVPRTGHRRAWTGFALLTAAVAGEVALFIAYRHTESHALAGGLLGMWALLFAGVLVVAWPWKLWCPLPTPDRSAKFIRTAYGWLLLSLTMLLLLPGYLILVGLAFSHAYYGAIRHAITVGFISLMIMGMAAKIVPVLKGRDARTLPSLWLPFVLVNAGCLLRVSTQTLTDWHPAFFGIIGVSGTLELTGLAIWSAHLVRLMLTPGSPALQPLSQTQPTPAPGHRTFLLGPGIS